MQAYVPVMTPPLPLREAVVDRWLHDPIFHAVVASFEHVLLHTKMTPEDLYAALRYAQERVALYRAQEAMQ